MQFIISVNDRVSLPCPPADLVQEDLWGRRSPEIQAPPGNIQQRCQRDLDAAHTKFLLSKGCSHRVFQSLQLTAVPFVLGCPHQVPPVDQVVPLGQRYPAGKRDCVSFWMSFNMKLKAFAYKLLFEMGQITFAPRRPIPGGPAGPGGPGKPLSP